MEWLDPGRLVDGDLELMLRFRAPGDVAKGWAPAYHFDMFRRDIHQRVGQIDLRIGHTPHLKLYGGHIGYGVDPEYRGRHYAARSVALLLPLAKKHGINPVWITCNPDNWASRRTCELAGGALIEIVDLPSDLEMYREGERRKCRYRFDLV
jgi:tagatose 1,6-diphosphate aldolase